MRDVFVEIWQTARRNKLRTTLTGFAVAWGIFMLIVLLGAGNGLINANLKQNENWLSNSMEVWGGMTSKAYQGLKEGRRIRLQTSDLAMTESDFPETVDEVGARYETSTTISYGDEYISTTITGVYPVHTKINKHDMLYGRFVNDIDMREKRKVLVLSNRQAKELEPRDYSTLLGKYVKVGNFAFKVIGIYKDREEGQSEAYSSYAAIKGIFGANNDEVGSLEYTFHGLTTEKANDRRLNANHQVHPDDERAFWIFNGYTMSLQMEQGIAIIRTALWIVGLFTLLSGIVGVSNIMLITVKERTHEFGIRKAIGAKPWSILKLIIIESVIIATLGHETIDTGLFKATMFLDPTVGLDVCFEATMVMVIAGTIAGLIPAYKASRIRPIEALRAD